MLNQETALSIIEGLGAQDVPRQKFSKKPRAVEAGCITSMDLDGSTRVVPFGLLVTFDSLDQLRQALEDGKLEFSFLE